MNYLLIALFLIFAIAYLLRCFHYKDAKNFFQNKNLKERDYWEQIIKKCFKGFLAGLLGAALAAIAIGIRQAVAAEIGCITFLAANVYLLAIFSKKTNIPLSENSAALVKKKKITFLALSFLGLFMTQLVFQYFNLLASL